MRRPLLATTVLTLLLGAPAHADVALHAPEQPAAAIGAGGTAAVTWLRRGRSVQKVMLAVRSPGGRFGAPIAVAERPEDPHGITYSLENPKVRADRAGNALITWRREWPLSHDSPPDELWMRWRLSDGRLSGAARVPGRDVVLSPAGRAWATVDDGSARVVATMPGEAFGSPLVIPGVAGAPQLSATDDGGTLALVTDFVARSARLVALAPDGAVRRSVGVFDDPSMSELRFSATPAGAAAVTYLAGTNLRLVTVPAGGESAKTEVVPGDTAGARSVSALGPADDGGVVMLWNRASNATGTEALIRGANGAYGPITALGPAGPRNADITTAAFAPDGSALLATVHSGSSVTTITRRPGGTLVFGPRVSAEGRRVGSTAAVALGGGTSLLTWVDSPLAGESPVSARLVALQGFADGGARRDIIDEAVRDPNPPTSLFEIERFFDPQRIDRAGRLRLTLVCTPAYEHDGCASTLRVRRSRRGAVLARRTMRRRAGVRVRVHIALPPAVVRDVRAGRRATLWLTMRATSGPAKRDLALRLRRR